MMWRTVCPPPLGLQTLGSSLRCVVPSRHSPHSPFSVLMTFFGQFHGAMPKRTAAIRLLRYAPNLPGCHRAASPPRPLSSGHCVVPVSCRCRPAHSLHEGRHVFAAPINVVPVEIHVWCVRDAVFPPSPSVRSSALPPLSDLSGAWDDGSVEGGLFRRRVVSILPSLLEVEADSLVEKIDVSVDFFIWVWFFVLAVDTRRD